MNTDTARNVEQTPGDEKSRLLESCADTVRALKGFIAEYDRLRGERDHLKREISSVHGEVDMLRKQVEQLKGQCDQLSNTLSTVTKQLESFASRSLDMLRRAGAADESIRSNPPEERAFGKLRLGALAEKEYFSRGTAGLVSD
jgi:chromosome segregation ATPase